MLVEDREDLALNVYIAFCYYKLAASATPPNSRYLLLYRVLEPLGRYIVGTWRVRDRLEMRVFTVYVFGGNELRGA